MSPKQTLNSLADKFGILPEYRDMAGKIKATSPDTQLALLRANGLVLDNDAMVVEALAEVIDSENHRSCPTEIIVEANQPLSLDFGAGAEWRLRFDDGNEDAQSGRAGEQLTLPALKPGLHSLAVDINGTTETIVLIAAPSRLPMIADISGNARIWGINLALYALVSGRRGGLGDYAGLAQAARALGQQGGDFLGINPVHALGWNNGGTISPYSPSHRAFLNTSHIAPGQITGLSNNQAAARILAIADDVDFDPRALALIDYPKHEKRHENMLEKLHSVFLNEADTAALDRFHTFCADHSQALADFALFEALSEEQGPDWRNWPGHLKTKNAQEIALARQRLAGRIQFHSWLQWLADDQLECAQLQAKKSGMGLGLYLDFAVGSRRGGAESWCDGDAVAHGVSLGAPPDHLNPLGQNWDLVAYSPKRLSACQYGPWRRAIAGTMRHSGILRIDHVMGMNRSFWIPDDGTPGAYIRQPFDAFLGLVAVEAERAKTLVIGEDLGLLPDGFRDTMRARGFYGYSVLQYEKNSAGKFKGYDKLRPQSLACFGTHDTPTMKGFIAGRDIDWWEKLGWIDQKTATEARRKRKAEVKGLLQTDAIASGSTDNFDSFSDSIHLSLAKSPASLVSVQLDDVFAQTEAQNLPGTIDEHPNWQRRVPVETEAFSTDRRLLKISEIMSDGGRGRKQSTSEEIENAG